jgi:hypothetical protein
VTASLHRDAALSTTVKLRVIGQQQQLLRIDFERAPSHEVLAAKLDEYERLVDEADAVVLSDYGKGGLERVQEMIQLAAGHRNLFSSIPRATTTSATGGHAAHAQRGEFREVAGRWSDEADLARRAQKLRAELDLDALIVTRSEEGMSLFTRREATTRPTQAREVFDVSGAGDTVIGVLALMVAAARTCTPRCAWPTTPRASWSASSAPPCRTRERSWKPRASAHGDLWHDRHRRRRLHRLEPREGAERARRDRHRRRGQPAARREGRQPLRPRDRGLHRQAGLHRHAARGGLDGEFDAVLHQGACSDTMETTGAT